MRKLLIIAMLLAVCACKTSQETTSVRTIKITNFTEYTIVFSNIDNGGDDRFWPDACITLRPGEFYRQTNYEIQRNTSVVYVPLAMDVECNGRTVRITSELTITHNPCILGNWYYIDSYTTHGPGIHYEFEIMREDIENWFPSE